LTLCGPCASFIEAQIEFSECLPTLLNRVAEKTCLPQVVFRQRFLAAVSIGSGRIVV
jgi:hypothetical protein